MKVISSKEYALNIEDAIEHALADGLYSAFEYIMRIYGMNYDERQVNWMRISEDFMDGIAAEWREQAITLFEKHGMDIRPDGKEW